MVSQKHGITVVMGKADVKAMVASLKAVGGIVTQSDESAIVCHPSGPEVFRSLLTGGDRWVTRYDRRVIAPVAS